MTKKMENLKKRRKNMIKGRLYEELIPIEQLSYKGYNTNELVNAKICLLYTSVKVFRLEKEPITLQQWVENLKNGDSSKRLVLSMISDNKGNVTAELAMGSYEVKVEKYGLNKVCELM